MEPCITAGDNVIVVTLGADGQRIFRGAVVVRTPAGAGDLWQFQTEEGVYALNPYCPLFERIVRCKTST